VGASVLAEHDNRVAGLGLPIAKLKKKKEKKKKYQGGTRVAEESGENLD